MQLLESIDVAKFVDARNLLAFDYICQLLTRMEFDIIKLLPPPPGTTSPKARPLPPSFLSPAEHLRVAQLYRDQLIATVLVVFDLMRERLRRMELRAGGQTLSASAPDPWSGGGAIDISALENLDLDQPASISRATPSTSSDVRPRDRSLADDELAIIGDDSTNNKLLVKFMVKTLAVYAFACLHLNADSRSKGHFSGCRSFLAR